MANANDKYSDNTITPAQRGFQDLGRSDGNYAAGWSAVPAVENAHDQQNAPTNLYTAPLDNNITNAPKAAPVADRQGTPDTRRTGPTNLGVLYPPTDG